MWPSTSAASRARCRTGLRPEAPLRKRCRQPRRWTAACPRRPGTPCAWTRHASPGAAPRRATRRPHPAPAQVVHTQVDGAELGETLQTLHRRLVHVARADGRHHGQAAHGVQPRADHAAVDALVAVMPDELGFHRNTRRHALGRDLSDLQAQHAVEGDLLLEDVLERRDEGGLEAGRRERWGGFHQTLEKSGLRFCLRRKRSSADGLALREPYFIFIVW